MATETCYKCGGQGGEPGANFGDYGWHPCYKCGETGRLPAGTQDREYQAYLAELRDNPPRPAYREDYYDE